MEDQNKRAGAWTHEETVLLIELWGTKEYKLNWKTHQDKSRICTDMKDRILDFGRSPQDCRGRIKRLKTKYFQVKRMNKKSGGKRTSFPYHERMGTTLGTRPSVNPVALSDSLNSQDDENTKDEDDTSDMSRQPESQPRSEPPGPSRPGTPGSSRFYSSANKQR
ncbi:unnamed protein product [Mytilus coruscus]|uniref:Myb/SANT-like DNA-binding domain-containing protein n=1 Tax=Mytilus coruscus TaxID=42192 RepID=A0A6J8CRB7_MYTCO|nr:unnamed protein product [Mytilus coruscus]